jgi:hypothetical protein
MRTALLSLAAFAALAVTAGPADARPRIFRGGGGWGNGYGYYNRGYARPYYGGYYRPHYRGYYNNNYYRPGVSIFAPGFGLSIGSGYGGFGYPYYGGAGYRYFRW